MDILALDFVAMGGNMDALADIASLLADWAREPRIIIDVICLLPIVVPTFNLQEMVQLGICLGKLNTYLAIFETLWSLSLCAM